MTKMPPVIPRTNSDRSKMDFAGVETGAKMSVGLEGRCNRCEIAVGSVFIKISAKPPMRFALGEAALHAPCPVRKIEFRGISLSVGMRGRCVSDNPCRKGDEFSESRLRARQRISATAPLGTDREGRRGNALPVAKYFRYFFSVLDAQRADRACRGGRCLQGIFAAFDQGPRQPATSRLSFNHPDDHLHCLAFLVRTIAWRLS